MKKVILFSFNLVERLIFIISLFLILSINVNALGYNYAAFNWDEFVEENKDYWASVCETDDDTGKCVDKVFLSQKKFYTKFYKMLSKYERNGLYINDKIILSTIYFGLTPDYFKDNNENYSSLFGDIAFDFNQEADDISVDDSDVTPDLIKEQNTIKMLIKAMIGYESTCSKYEDVLYEEDTENEVKNPYCNQGTLVGSNTSDFKCKSLLSTHFVGLGEKLLDKSKLLSFFGFKSDHKKKCEADGGVYDVASKATVSENAYWDFLENSEFFDKKSHLKNYFAYVLSKSGYSSILELDSAMENDENVYNQYHQMVINCRKDIIEDIKESLSLYYGDDPGSDVLFGTMTNTFFWPIGSETTTSENGVLFAKGDPVSSYVIKDYNPGTSDGIDIGAVGDTISIIAIKPGVVSKINDTCTVGDKICGDGYGNYVMISHSDGSTSVYAFLESISVSVNDSVSSGQVIGIMGKTGNTYQRALHFEIILSSGAKANPNNYVSQSNPRATVGSVQTINGTSNKQSVCLSLKSSGASDAGVAGIMANINSESGFISNNLQDGYEKILHFNDVTYTAAVDNGSYTNFVNDEAGYGLCQWTYKTRKQALLNLVKQNGVSVSDVGVQLNFLFRELQSGYSSLYNSIMTGNANVSAIASNFCHNFENPLVHSQCDGSRVDVALQYYTYVKNGCN